MPGAPRTAPAQGRGFLTSRLIRPVVALPILERPTSAEGHVADLVAPDPPPAERRRRNNHSPQVPIEALLTGLAQPAAPERQKAVGYILTVCDHDRLHDGGARDPSGGREFGSRGRLAPLGAAPPATSYGRAPNALRAEQQGGAARGPLPGSPIGPLGAGAARRCRRPQSGNPTPHRAAAGCAPPRRKPPAQPDVRLGSPGTGLRSLARRQWDPATLPPMWLPPTRGRYCPQHSRQ